MKTKIMVVCLAVAMMVVMACPLTAAIEATKLSNSAVEFFPSADSSGNLWCTMNQSLYKITPSGSIIYEGIGTGSVDSPVWYQDGLAMFDSRSGYRQPVIWDWSKGIFTYPFSTWSDWPWVGPRVSPDGDSVAFAAGNQGSIGIYNGSASTVWDQFDPTAWQIASIDWADNNNLWVVAQDRYDFDQYGYHLFRVNTDTHQASDLGKGYSQVSVAGDLVALTSWNHSSCNLYQWDGTGLDFFDSIYAPNVSYWNLGGSSGNYIALLDSQNRPYLASVPEPSSILAILTGSIGMIGAFRRRKK